MFFNLKLETIINHKKLIVFYFISIALYQMYSVLYSLILNIIFKHLLTYTLLLLIHNINDIHCLNPTFSYVEYLIVFFLYFINVLTINK